MSAQQSGRAVTVGVDGSDSAAAAAAWAATEAARHRVPLRLVTAFPWTPEHVGLRGRGERDREILLDRAGRQLAAVADSVRRAVAGLDVEEQIIDGSPVPVLMEEARDAELMVIGDRGLGGVRGLFAGSVAVALAAHGACPVVVVRGAPGGDPDFSARPVVVGVEGSPTGEAAIAFAYEAAALRGVPLVAVHTWRDTPRALSLDAPADRALIEAQERELLSERLAGWGEKFPDVRVRRLVTPEPPAQALVGESARAQLVVVGSRGRGGLGGLLLGSVSHAVLHRSACPVAVVRPDAEGPR